MLAPLVRLVECNLQPPIVATDQKRDGPFAWQNNPEISTRHLPTSFIELYLMTRGGLLVRSREAMGT